MSAMTPQEIVSELDRHIVGQAQAEITDGEENDTHTEHHRRCDAIGQRAGGIAGCRVDQVVGDVGQDDLDDGEADLVEPQQQQRIGEDDQPEDHQDGDGAPVPARERADAP